MECLPWASTSLSALPDFAQCEYPWCVEEETDAQRG